MSKPTQTKTQKFKKFVNDHAAELTIVTGSIALIGAWCVIVNSETKRMNEDIAKYNDWADKENQWLEEQNSAGNAVYALLGGGYLVAPDNGPQQYVQR